METITISWAPNADWHGQRGAWQATLKENPGIYDIAGAPETALEKILITLPTFGYSGNQDDYNVVVEQKPE
jgi:hypothetical protein